MHKVMQNSKCHRQVRDLLHSWQAKMPQHNSMASRVVAGTVFILIGKKWGEGILTGPAMTPPVALLGNSVLLRLVAAFPGSVMLSEWTVDACKLSR